MDTVYRRQFAIFGKNVDCLELPHNLMRNLDKYKRMGHDTSTCKVNRFGSNGLCKKILNQRTRITNCLTDVLEYKNDCNF